LKKVYRRPAYSVGEIDNPLTQRITWFSYLGGSDIAEACGRGAGERYRIIYNGRYEEQLRSYEVTVHGDSADLVVRVREQANLTELSTADLLAPWRWRKAVALPPELAELRRHLADRILPGRQSGWCHPRISTGPRAAAGKTRPRRVARGSVPPGCLCRFPVGPRPDRSRSSAASGQPVVDYLPSPLGNREEREQPIHDHFLERSAAAPRGAPGGPPRRVAPHHQAD
jgi:hypothetical protein